MRHKKETGLFLTLIFSLFFIYSNIANADQQITNEFSQLAPSLQAGEDLTKEFAPEPDQRPRQKVALTFDDGPDLRNTPKILDILKNEGVVATFFVVGNQVERYPEVLVRIFNENHLIANHSRTHADFTTLTNEEIISLELEPTSQAVEKLTGYYPTIMRPPWGSLRVDSISFLREQGWRIVRWSLDTFDWDSTRNKPEQIMSRILANHHPNAIILMHCNGPATTKVLPDIIETLRNLNYDFVTVDQL